MKTKIYIVVQSWTDLENHHQQYIDCFADEVEAYKKALSIAGDNYKPEVLTKELDIPNIDLTYPYWGDGKKGLVLNTINEVKTEK